jgi:hypothetical protein
MHLQVYPKLLQPPAGVRTPGTNVTIATLGPFVKVLIIFLALCLFWILCEKKGRNLNFDQTNLNSESPVYPYTLFKIALVIFIGPCA